MADKSFDFVIVGGGVMGLSAARALVLQGRSKVLVLDQFPLPHARGSSHGHSRIYRTAYHHKVLGEMAKASIEEWGVLERQFGSRLLHNCGVLVTGSEQLLLSSQACIAREGAAADIWSSAELARELPAMSQLLDGFDRSQRFLLDRTGGVMSSALCMQALLRFCLENGVEVREEKVVEIRPHGVRSRGAEYSCRSVIVTAGPWAPKLLSHLDLHLPVKPSLVAALYWQVKDGAAEDFQVPGFLPFIDYYGQEYGDHVYALPAREYPDCVKFGHQTGAPVDPDLRDMAEFPPQILRQLQDYVRTHLPRLEPSRPAIKEPCMYTDSPDYLYVIDKHPRHPSIVIATGFTGNGFKMGPTVGKILADLAQGRSPGFDLTDFSLQRFQRRAAL